MQYFFLLVLIIFSCPSFASAREASYYENFPTGDLRCHLCPRECVIKDGDTGTCRVRKNVKGRLESLTYGRACAANIDPIEKKPFFHFLPASRSFSVAAAGCNLRCLFCQNWPLSQGDPSEIRTVTLLPEQLVQAAKDNHCPSISYTYSEPTAFYEYMYDTAWLARQHGIRNMLVSCGYMNPEPLKKLCTVIDAANVDLKGFSDRVYRRMAGARLAPVLATLKTLKAQGVWLEVGYLVIPTVNDSPDELRSFVQWVRKELGPEVPLHFLRFHPQHRLTNLPPTPVETLEKACSLAHEAGIQYVYIGNVPGHASENTYCAKCGKMIIKRKGYFVEEVHMEKGRCAFCGNKIPGVWK